MQHVWQFTMAMEVRWVKLQRPIQLCKVAAVGLKCEVAEIPHQYLTRRQKRRVDAKT